MGPNKEPGLLGTEFSTMHKAQLTLDVLEMAAGNTSRRLAYHII